MTAAHSEFIHVTMSGWEIECCVDPPKVGDSVSWTLRLITDVDRAEEPRTFTGSVEPWAEDTDLVSKSRWPAVLTTPGFVAFFEATEPVVAGSQVHIEGYLLADEHGQTPPIPETAGVVETVDVITTHVSTREPNSRTWYPTEGVPPKYRAVDTSPKWFAWGGDEPAHERESGIRVGLRLER